MQRVQFFRKAKFHRSDIKYYGVGKREIIFYLFLLSSKNFCSYVQEYIAISTRLPLFNKLPALKQSLANFTPAFPFIQIIYLSSHELGKIKQNKHLGKLFNLGSKKKYNKRTFYGIPRRLSTVFRIILFWSKANVGIWVFQTLIQN